MGKVIVLSGVSGSGKSTHATKLLSAPDRLGSACVVSADQFFIRRTEKNPHGEYVFDAAKLSQAHADCFHRFINALQGGVDLVIVDNTNTTNEELAPYMLAAAAFEYEAEIVSLYLCMPFPVQIDKCVARNTHGVSEQAIANQHYRLGKRHLLPWWKNTSIPVKL